MKRMFRTFQQGNSLMEYVLPAGIIVALLVGSIGVFNELLFDWFSGTTNMKNANKIPPYGTALNPKSLIKTLNSDLLRMAVTDLETTCVAKLKVCIQTSEASQGQVAETTGGRGTQDYIESQMGRILGAIDEILQDDPGADDLKAQFRDLADISYKIAKAQEDLAKAIKKKDKNKIKALVKKLNGGTITYIQKVNGEVIYTTVTGDQTGSLIDQLRVLRNDILDDPLLAAIPNASDALDALFDIFEFDAVSVSTSIKGNPPASVLASSEPSIEEAILLGTTDSGLTASTASIGSTAKPINTTDGDNKMVSQDSGGTLVALEAELQEEVNNVEDVLDAIDTDGNTGGDFVDTLNELAALSDSVDSGVATVSSGILNEVIENFSDVQLADVASTVDVVIIDLVGIITEKQEIKDVFIALDDLADGVVNGITLTNEEIVSQRTQLTAILNSEIKDALVVLAAESGQTALTEEVINELGDALGLGDSDNGIIAGTEVSIVETVINATVLELDTMVLAEEITSDILLDNGTNTTTIEGAIEAQETEGTVEELIEAAITDETVLTAVEEIDNSNLASTTEIIDDGVTSIDETNLENITSTITETMDESTLTDTVIASTTASAETAEETGDLSCSTGDGTTFQSVSLTLDTSICLE